MTEHVHEGESLPAVPGSPQPLGRPALVATAVAAFAAFVATFLPWLTAGITGPGAEARLSYDGTFPPMLGWLSLFMSVCAGGIVMVLAARPVPDLWALLPVTGLLMATAAVLSLVRMNTTFPSGADSVLLVGSPSWSLRAGPGLWITLGSGVALMAIPLLARVLASGRRAPA